MSLNGNTIQAQTFVIMKQVLLLITLLWYVNLINAQNHDFYWPFGYASYSPLPDIGGSVIDFNSFPPMIFPQDVDMNFDFTCASICDTLGNLLFYTNGEYIANYLNEKIPGSDTLNPGALFNNVTPYGYRIIQGALILPSPKENEENLYYVFHEIGEYLTQDLWEHASGLYFTVVDMDMNNGTGGIVSKRNIVIQDTLIHGKLQAVRHANGRDWWILAAEHATNRFYRILLDTAGVHLDGIQSVGNPAHPFASPGQVAFSPDGSHYARFYAVNLTYGADLDIYDFDRCTGEFYNPRHAVVKDSCYGGGVAFSPNSRFLYVVSTYYLYQFDMWANDIIASKDTVAFFDGFADPLPTWFFLAQLGPDGKIYINTRSNGRYLHVIHNPDEPGDACNVEQHAIQLPTYNAWTMPNFPNYRLGAIPPITPSFTYSVSNDTVFFQNTSTGGKEYAWDFGDGTTGQGAMPEHVYEQPGVYSVTLTVNDQCVNETITETILVDFTDAEEREGKEHCYLFPNPCTKGTNVILHNYLPRNASIVLYSAAGQRVIEHRLLTGWNSLPLDAVPPGMYFYEIRESGRKVKSGKLVKVE